MSKRAKGALAAGAGVIALTMTVLVKPWEGRTLEAHWDAIGRVYDICYGDTLNVKPGMTATPEECDARLAARLRDDFYKPLTVCIPGYETMPVSLQASMLSAAYNVGVRAICGSTAARLAKVRNYAGACDAVTKFNRAGGRVIRGLKLRREYGDANRIGELELCKAGL